jgi:isoleucyl-tRNA synthetase
MEKESSEPETVVLMDWPSCDQMVDSAFMEKWDTLVEIRSIVLGAIEGFRSTGRHSLDAEVVLYPLESGTETLLTAMKDSFEELFIVSSVVLFPMGENVPEDALRGEMVAVMVREAPGQRCSRCWKKRESVKPDSKEFCTRCFTIVKDRYPEVLSSSG